MARTEYLEHLMRRGYYVEPLTPAGLAGCVAVWGSNGDGSYLVARETAVGVWEHD